MLNTCNNTDVIWQDGKTPRYDTVSTINDVQRKPIYYPSYET